MSRFVAVNRDTVYLLLSVNEWLSSDHLTQRNVRLRPALRDAGHRACVVQATPVADLTAWSIDSGGASAR